MTYAILVATDTDTTLHTQAKDWCKLFTDEWQLLGADGLADPSETVQSPRDTDNATIARMIDVDARELAWSEESTIYVFASPAWLDQETGDPFRRTIRTMLDRLADEVIYPFDHLEQDEHGPWFMECIEAGEIKSPHQRYEARRGMDQSQRDLDSF